MNKNMSDFERKYIEAVDKAAIGAYVIRTVGEASGLSPLQIKQNIVTLCNELADGIQLHRATVLSDVINAEAQLPVSYTTHPAFLTMMKDLFKVFNTKGLLGPNVIDLNTGHPVGQC